jgi:hypothetical protein
VKICDRGIRRYEEVDAGVVHASSDVYTEYLNPRRDPWETTVRPVLGKIPLKAFEA